MLRNFSHFRNFWIWELDSGNWFLVAFLLILQPSLTCVFLGGRIAFFVNADGVFDARLLSRDSRISRQVIFQHKAVRKQKCHTAIATFEIRMLCFTGHGVHPKHVCVEYDWHSELVRFH